MLKSKLLTIGIDVSKKKLDITFIQDASDKTHRHFIISNCKKGVLQLLKETQKLGYSPKELLVCFEHTGIYSMPLCYYLQELEVSYTMVPAIEIHRSKGLTRGKNDKVDSRDIAYYAITHRHKIKPTQLPTKILVKLKYLLSFRDKLVRAIGSFQRTKELEGFLPKEMIEEVIFVNRQTISLLKKRLKSIDQKIEELIQTDPQLFEKFKLAKSVIGVGNQTAMQLLITTQGFTTFDNWRKLACYCGTAPFEYSSGSSIRGRTKVSPIANKKLKSVLNMAAITAIRYDPELKKYYERKLEEGKNAMLVINSVRCKILSRVMATVKRETPYVKLGAY